MIEQIPLPTSELTASISLATYLHVCASDKHPGYPIDPGRVQLAQPTQVDPQSRTPLSADSVRPPQSQPLVSGPPLTPGQVVMNCQVLNFESPSGSYPHRPRLLCKMYRALAQLQLPQYTPAGSICKSPGQAAQRRTTNRNLKLQQHWHSNCRSIPVLRYETSRGLYSHPDLRSSAFTYVP